MIAMASGGARARSGPAPDPEALNRLRGTDAAWHVLPVTGRPGPPPEWPLPNPSSRELELWVKLWAKPQATRWEILGQDDEVALYCRRFARAEQPDAPVATVVVVRQLGEALGLTIPGMLRNRWQIGSQQSAPAPTVPAPTGGKVPSRSSARDRFTVVRDDH
ncbi:MAG: hypothetical protein QOE30_4994 [Mycobacterium sp.]|jgi:hypothetical protein|nr:hypothetical protein [Mycobacterium sp.]